MCSENTTKAPSTRRRLATQTLVNAYFYLRPHEDDHRLCSAFTRPHESACKRMKRCHTPNPPALSIWVAIFASAPLDKRDWRWHPTSAFSQRLRKYTFTAVHTKTHRRRFQIYPLWRAFSNLCVYGERFHRLRVDGRPKRIKKFPFTSVCVDNRLRVDGAWGCAL